MDYGNLNGLIWLDGALVPWRDARIHVLTHALHYGSAVFEGVRSYDGHASGAMGLGPGGALTHVAIAAWQWPSPPTAQERLKGITLTIAPWRRPAPDTASTRAKASGLYQICTMSKSAAEQAGYDDALMLDYRGFVAESTGANIFFVFGEQLHTPIPDCFLDGITRRSVICIARTHGIEVIERHIRPEDLAQASEVFITGTAIEIMPVRRIQQSDFAPARVCRLMIEEYAALTKSALA